MISVSHSNVSAQGISILRVVSNVDAGGGNSSVPINQFKPSVINITTNETLKWINPTSGILILIVLPLLVILAICTSQT